MTKTKTICSNYLHKGDVIMWYLQVNKQGQQFWDDYLHPDCTLLIQQNYNPFQEN